MGKTNYDEAQTELIRAIEEDAPHTFDEPIPVAVTLDNGVRYEGLAYEVQAKSKNFPAGLDGTYRQYGYWRSSQLYKQQVKPVIGFDSVGLFHGFIHQFA